MARKKHVVVTSPVSSEEVADAFRSTFRSKVEIDEMFGEFEAALVRTVNEVYGRYKRKRDAEWPLPPDDLPTEAAVTRGGSDDDVER